MAFHANRPTYDSNTKKKKHKNNNTCSNFERKLKKNEWAAVHADILVLYKVRHQRFLKFTWYTVYTYKTTKFFKCIKGSLSECIQQILKLWSCWFSGLSTGHLLQQWDLSRKDRLFNLPLKLWGSETNPHDFYRTKLECLQDLILFFLFYIQWF